MKKSLFVFCPFLLGSMVLYLANGKQQTATVYDGMKRLSAIGCAPLDGDVVAGSDGKFIRVMPGWGSYAYTISTTSDSAQTYFNQGLTMYYSYHWREAVASFKEAARFDSTNPMVYWGQALALGPTYNYGYAYKMNKSIPAVLDKMNGFAYGATPKEKALLEAMNRRYNPTDTADTERKALNTAYATAMKALVGKYAADVDIKALYTDAVMLTHAWDFWYNDGRPKAWTPELMRHCEDILTSVPHHPGALHYYIHITEASRKPEVALPGADTLLKLFPGVAHMVHMSSHEYERIGYYAKGVDANERADRSLVVYDSLAKGLLPQVHVPHYFAVDAYCAMSGAMYKRGIQKALTCRHSVRPDRDNLYAQYQYMFPQLAMVRMGKWEDVLKDTTVVNEGWIYSGILDHFAKGMAYARTGNPDLTAQHLAGLRQKQKEDALKERFAPHTSSPYEVSVVVENILAATISVHQKKDAEAIATFKKAILAEDSLLYSEPKIWLLPARQYLGAYLMQLARPAEAETVFREDLIWNPGNGWSLVGLYGALKAQGKRDGLDKIKQQYLGSFSEADEVPNVAAY